MCISWILEVFFAGIEIISSQKFFNDEVFFPVKTIHFRPIFLAVLIPLITLLLFPRIKPFLKDIIDNEYILDVGLGITIFIIVVFLVLMINRGISKALRYSGIGSLDTLFGFFFGFIRAYIICVCIFSGVHIVYNYDKWPINLNKSYAFPYLEKGSNYLLKEFPNEKTYQNSKEKIEEL